MELEQVLLIQKSTMSGPYKKICLPKKIRLLVTLLAELYFNFMSKSRKKKPPTGIIISFYHDPRIFSIPKFSTTRNDKKRGRKGREWLRTVSIEGYFHTARWWSRTNTPIHLQYNIGKKAGEEENEKIWNREIVKSKPPLASPRSTNSKTHKNASLSQKSSSVVNIPAAVKFKKRENGGKICRLLYGSVWPIWWLAAVF